MADIVIAGAGPVGSLLALMLARRGYSVELYERRSRGFGGSGRSINLAVSTRGLHALSQVGLDAEVLASAVPMHGRMTHARDGATQLLPYGGYINSMSRGGLNALLAERAEAAGVRVHYGQKLLVYRDGIAELSDAHVVAPIIIGADGAGSALRESLGVSFTNEVLSAGYKELTLPALPGGGFAMHREALHIWPRGDFMMIALPNRDGSFTCTLFLDAERLRKLDAPAFMSEYFPDLYELMPDAAERLSEAPLGHMQTIKAWPWSAGGALILGDAAHAIVPFFGQGMNAGFEDVTLLDEVLARTPDLPLAFARFAAGRKPDTDAIADLAVENFLEMRDKVADPEFLKLRALEHELQERMGGRYLTRYQLVTFTRLPYRKALQIGRLQHEILLELSRTGDFAAAIRSAGTAVAPLLAD